MALSSLMLPVDVWEVDHDTRCSCHQLNAIHLIQNTDTQLHTSQTTLTGYKSMPSGTRRLYPSRTISTQQLVA